MDNYDTIEIPISEDDIQMFEDLIRNGSDPFEWTFDDEKGIPHTIRFIREQEEKYE